MVDQVVPLRGKSDTAGHVVENSYLLAVFKVLSTHYHFFSPFARRCTEFCAKRARKMG